MENAACAVTVGFIEQAGIKQCVVDNQEEQTPAHKGKIEAAQALEKEGLFVVECSRLKEVTGTEEKDGNVKLKDETA